MQSFVQLEHQPGRPHGVATPFLTIIEVTAIPEWEASLKKLLIRAIELYLHCNGVIDCKVVQSLNRGHYLLFCSWESPGQALLCKQDKAWEDWNRTWKTAQQKSKIQVKQIVGDQYEVVE